MPKSKAKPKAPTLKTRRPVYLRNISERVWEDCGVKAKELGIPRWLLIEKILEITFNHDTSLVDAKTLLGIPTKKPKYVG